MNRFYEAQRIKEVAMRQYAPGTFLAATFITTIKNQDKKHDWYFFNPKDIPLTIYRGYKTYYLYSVHKTEIEGEDEWTKRKKSLNQKRSLRSSSNRAQ